MGQAAVSGDQNTTFTVRLRVGWLNLSVLNTELEEIESIYRASTSSRTFRFKKDYDLFWLSLLLQYLLDEILFLTTSNGHKQPWIGHFSTGDTAWFSAENRLVGVSALASALNAWV